MNTPSTRRNVVFVGSSVIVILMVVLVAALLALSSAASRIAKVDYPHTDAVMEFKYEITAYRLALAEKLKELSMDGLDDVWRRHVRAEQFLDVVLEGGVRMGTQYTRISDPDLRNSINDLKVETDALGELGMELTVLGGGPDFDDARVDFDELFAHLIEDAEIVEEVLLKKVERDIAKFDMLRLLLIAGLLIVGGVVLVAYMRTERQKSRFIADLQDAHGDLERRVAERTSDLEERQEFIRAMVGSMVDAVITIDAKGTLTSFNKAAENIFGYREEDVVGRNIKMLMPDPYQREHDGYLANYHETRDPKIIGQAREVEGLRKDGSTFPLSLAVSEVQSGGVSHFTGIVRDLTKVKAAEEKVRRSEELLSTAIENISDGFVIFDENDRLVMSNRRLRHIFSRSSDLLVPGREIGEILLEGALRGEYEDAEGREEEWVGEQLKGWRENHSVYEMNLGGGQWVRATDCLLPNGGHVGIRTDVSDLKKIQLELESARQLAEDANKMKSDFLANMSHEIRTPMNAIIGMSHLALKTDLDDRQRDYVDKVHSSAQSLLGIINDILDFSKIEAGKMDMETIDFRLDDVLSNVANVTTVKAEDKGLELLISRAADIPVVLKGDPLRLGQILLNLADNAIKFTAEGEVVIGVEAIEVRKNDVILRFFVRDTGVGLTKEQADKLFTAFSQADTSTTRKYGGTGLGLAISKQLVEMMGGEISLDSEYGEGSTFYFTAHMELGKIDANIARAVERIPSGLRCLVADDSDVSRQILSEILKSFSFDVTTVSSGEKAVKALQDAAAPFDFAVLDWRMPGMDGIEAAKTIKAAGGPDMPHFILVTGHDRVHAMSEAPEGLFASFLGKPVTPSHIFDAVVSAIGLDEVMKYRRGTEKKTSQEALAIVRGAHVLLVEDNEINQQVAEELLIGFGVTVDIAENGEIAIEKLQSHSGYAAVFMDLQMPVMDGFTATGVIRDDVRFKNLPIIAMTANAMSGDREQCLEAGMNDYIAKPVDPDVLLDVMSQWIVGIGKSVAQSAPDPEPLQSAPLPTSLPGVDVASGLRRMAGNERLYRKLSGEFVADHMGAAERLRELGAGEDGVRLAHTLKGILGTFGAKTAQEQAATLEVQLKAGTLDEATFEVFSSALAEAMASLAMLNEGQKTEAAVAPVQDSSSEPDSEALLAGVKALTVRLEDGDPDAIDTAKGLTALVTDGAAQKKLKRLIKQVDDFDFEDAQVTLAALAELLGVDV